MQLRPYQKEAASNGVAFLKSKERHAALIVAPTGAGKSLIISEIASQLDGYCLVLQPSVELLTQNATKFDYYGLQYGIFSAGAKSKRIAPTTFATLASARNATHLFKDFRFVIIDEAHLYPAQNDKMLAQFLGSIQNVKVLGITATPFRLKSGGQPFLEMLTRNNIYKTIIHVTQIKDIQEYWCPIQYNVVDIKKSALDALEINAQQTDFTQPSVERFSDLVLNEVVQLVNQLEGSSLVFVPSVKAANNIASLCESTEVVSAQTGKYDREKAISNFKTGKIKRLVNVNILGVGFDFPALNNVVHGIPTLSLARLHQAIGRLTRQHESKTHGNFYDLAGNLARFGKLEDFSIHGTGTYWQAFIGGSQVTGRPIASISPNGNDLAHLLSMVKSK